LDFDFNLVKHLCTKLGHTLAPEDMFSPSRMMGTILPVLEIAKLISIDFP
jgi:hypothetical protein